MLEAETDQSHAVVGEVLASEAVQQLAVDVTNVEAWCVQRVREAVAERCTVDQVDQSLIIAHTIFKLFVVSVKKLAFFPTTKSRKEFSTETSQNCFNFLLIFKFFENTNIGLFLTRG